MSGNNDENFYRNNNSASSSADVLISKKDSGHHTKNTNDDGGDKPLARLLIVDDEYDIVQVLKLGLQQNGFLVDGFTNPQEALQSFKSNAESYCLLLSDVRMPGLSGMQLARKVKETNPDVKVVLMTAFEIMDIEFSKVFPSTQVDGLIQKPVRIRELIDKIVNIVGQSNERSNKED